MWEAAAIVDLLEQKGRCAERDLYDIFVEVRRKNRNGFVYGENVDAESRIGGGGGSSGLLPPHHQVDRVFYFVTRTSTRRFFARPAGVVFGSTGLVSA